MTDARNYVDTTITALAAELPDCDFGLLRLYALLVFTCGTETTLEDVHDAWAVWRASTRPDHPALVPFDQLTPDVQALDGKYADAIRKVAHGVAP